MQHHDHAVTLRESTEGPFEVHSIHHWEVDLGGRVISQLLGAPHPGSDLLAVAIEGDPVEPGSQGGFPAESLQCARRADPGILDDLFGVAHSAAAEPEREAIQGRRVSCVQDAKRPLVTRGEEGRNQGTVAGLVAQVHSRVVVTGTGLTKSGTITITLDIASPSSATVGPFAGPVESASPMSRLVIQG